VAIFLDGLSTDEEQAFQEFLAKYNGLEISLSLARQVAPDLEYEIPQSLPLGFRLKMVYSLEFGGEAGAAATYDRKDGEFLAVIFHPRGKNEDFGSHQGGACTIGRFHGHEIVVGDWKMIHLGAPKTCHCIVSRLNEKSELPLIFAAVVPSFAEDQGL